MDFVSGSALVRTASDRSSTWTRPERTNLQLKSKRSQRSFAPAFSGCLDRTDPLPKRHPDCAKKAPAKRHAEAQVSILPYREPGACAKAIRPADQSSLIVRSVLVPQFSQT